MWSTELVWRWTSCRLQLEGSARRAYPTREAPHEMAHAGAGPASTPLSGIESLPRELTAVILRAAGWRAVLSLERTSQATRTAALASDAAWASFVDDLWKSAPFASADARTVGEPRSRRRMRAAVRPTAGAGGHKQVFRASLADALTIEDLTSRPWYHTWSGLGPLQDLPCRYRIASSSSQLISTAPVVRMVMFHADGSMSWEGTQQPGSKWMWVERATMMGRVTPPGSTVQFKHLAVPDGAAEGDATELVFPALRVYRVRYGSRLEWVLRSGNDTFTSFRREAEGDGATPHELLDEAEPCVPTLMWRLHDLRKDAISSGHREDCRIRDGVDDADWLSAEADAFVADYLRILRHGGPSGLVFGNVLGNGFIKRG